MASRSRSIESLREYLRKARVYYEDARSEGLRPAEVAPEGSAPRTQGEGRAFLKMGPEGSSQGQDDQRLPGSRLDGTEDAGKSPVSRSERTEEEDSRDGGEQTQPYRAGQAYRSPTGAKPHLDQAWQRACDCLADGRTISCLVTGWNRGGLLVRWDELQGFVPASQLKETLVFGDDADREAQLMRRVGEELELRIIELDPSRNRLVLSERALSWKAEDGSKLLEGLRPGDVRHGRVSNICNFGAFVDLGGVDGLIHISELAWRRVSHPSEVLEIGQEVDVYVLDVDPPRRRVALSLKKLKDDPWLTVEQRYHVGQTVQGTITNVVSFGAFARIEDGLEGLIHVSELGEGSFFHPRNVVQEGDVVSLRILRVDSANRRIGLSLRQAGSEEMEEEARTSSPPAG